VDALVPLALLASATRAALSCRRSRVKAVLTPRGHGRAMVTRNRFRAVLNTLALYAIAAALIGYFGVNAYDGNYGLRAKQDLDQQIAELTQELTALKTEHATWERRVALLRPQSIDPDLLDERARTLLNYADPRDLTLRLKQP
jgi:cell division protein FtsB